MSEQRKRTKRTKGSAARDVSDRRVEELLRLMSEGLYVPGAGARALAESHPLFRGLSPERVQNLATEASRLLRLYWSQSEETRERVRTQALVNWARIRAKAENLGDARGFAVALEADRLILEFMGMRPPDKVEVQTRFSGWSKEELVEYGRSGKRPEHAATGMLRPK